MYVPAVCSLVGRRKLLQHKKKNDAVTLSHCQVQHSQKNDDLEVKLNSVTAVKKADKTFDFPTSNLVDSVVKQMEHKLTLWEGEVVQVRSKNTNVTAYQTSFYVNNTLLPGRGGN